MFQQIVSNLSFSPQALGQMTYYLRRLKAESVTRKLSAVVAVFVFVLQMFIVVRPPQASNAASTNDIIFGGLNGGDPKGDLLRIYDQDRDSAGHNGYHQLFDHFGITRDMLANTNLATINSSDHSLLSLGRNDQFPGQDQVIDLTAISPAPPPPANPYGCGVPHPQIQQGSTGGCVQYLQWSLNHKAGTGLAEDGIFGPLTNSAVRNFQAGQHIGVDGIVGPITWGRLDALPVVTASAAHVYYLKPLYLWDRPGTTSSYQVLAGRLANGSPFFVMVACGNIVVTNTPPPPPPPPPAPKPPTPTPPKPPTPVVQTPLISQAKAAAYLNKKDSSGKNLNASGTTAVAGDTIEYRLTTTNSGTGAYTGYTPAEDVSDILEYADIVQLNGGSMASGLITWPKVDIPAHSSVVNIFTVKIKDPIPTTARSTSNPLSFDLRLDNIYGNKVSVFVQPPPPKQIETATQSLPQTGAGGSVITLAFIALCMYFFMRNRQLIKEIQILRVDHNPGVQS